MTFRIVTVLFIVVIATVGSAALYPPSDVPKQVFVAVLWFAAGFGVSQIVSMP